MTNVTGTATVLATTFLKFSQEIEACGEWGPILYVPFLALVVSLSLPCTPLEMVPGFLYGFKVGVIVSIAGKLLGNLIAVTIVRRYFRAWALEYLNKFKAFRVVEILVKRGGLKPIFLVRLLPMPMAVKNYGLAVFDTKLSHITLCAFVTVIPFACLWNYVGSGVKDLLEIFEGGEKTAVTSLVPEELKLPIFAILIILGACLGVWVRKEYLLALGELEEIDLKKKTRKRAVKKVPKFEKTAPRRRAASKMRAAGTRKKSKGQQ